MELEIDNKQYSFKELIYYDGLKVGYDLSNQSLIVWHNEFDDYDEFLLLDCKDIFDDMVMYLLNEKKLKDIFLIAKIYMIQFHIEDMKVISVESLEGITLPTDNSYLGFSFLDNFKEPENSELSFSSIKSISYQIQNMFNDDISNIDDLMLAKFVQKLGGRVHYVNIDVWKKAEDGSILVHGHRDFDIFLPNFGGIEANRFTIAHEVGHYVIHSNIGQKQLKAAKYGDDYYEMEANFFAMSLLVPKEIIEDDSIDELQIANKYFVSVHNVMAHREFLDVLKNR